MKIHTDLTATDLDTCLDDTGIEGASLLMQEKKSRSKARRFDVHFDAEPMKGRRQSQHYDDGRPVTGITYDEWGLFIDRIYRLDPSARVGPYRNRDHFRAVTDYRFDTLLWANQCPRHRFVATGDHGMTCEKCEHTKYRNSRGFTA